MTRNFFETIATATTNHIDNKKRAIVRAKTKIACWVENYQKEISTLPAEKYYSRFELSGEVSTTPKHNSRFKLNINLENSQQTLCTEVRLWLNKAVISTADMYDIHDTADPTLAAAFTKRRLLFKEMREKCQNGVERYLNNKLKMLIQDPICGTKILPIRVNITWVDEQKDCHYIFRIHETEIRASVDEGFLSIWTEDTEDIHAHEVAHCLGMADEYSYVSGRQEHVRYFQTDGKLSEAIIAEPEGEEPSVRYSSIMNGGTALKQFHGFPIAIEAQQLLSEKLGRKIKCDILLA